MLSFIRSEKEYISLLSAYVAESRAPKGRPLLTVGLCEGAEGLFTCAITDDIKRQIGKNTLVVVPDEGRMSRLAAVLRTHGAAVLTFSARDMNFRNAAASHEAEHERLRVLSGLIDLKPSSAPVVILTTPDAALGYTVPPERLRQGSLILRRGESYSLAGIVDFLEKHGYTRSETVDGAGQYSVRGGILDVFSPASELPIRADFFGDEIDRLTTFDPLTQRSAEGIAEAKLIPARETIISDAAPILELLRPLAKRAKEPHVAEGLYSEIAALETGGTLYSADKYIAVAYPNSACLLDYADGSEFAAVVFDYNAVTDRERAAAWHSAEGAVAMLEEGSIPPKCAVYSRDISELVDRITRGGVIVNPFVSGMSGVPLGGIFTFSTRSVSTRSDNFDALLSDLRDYTESGYTVVLCASTDLVKDNIMTALSAADIPLSEEYRSGFVSVTAGGGVASFDSPHGKYALLALGGEGSERKRRTRRAAADKNLQKLMSYADLDVGDYVVHTVHGIGRYEGTQSLIVDNIRRDFIKIAYAGTDVLYVPWDQLDRVSKYIGARAEDGGLKLSHMGGVDFGKMKSRAKAAARDMAHELIELYAARLRKPGYAFSHDDAIQREFENSFEYEETGGQITAISDIKRDMENPHPMDRLLCGDVGYGKTEVALRAAFKAVYDHKQAAILVPTTILALQHYRTMLSRMRGFPVNIDMVSRFRSDKEIEQSLKKLKRGETDIIVGTHRLLSDDVGFHDLGLLIIDEEQRFGVGHKERLKKMAENVDTLTLTATPIPRTLGMALSGIRDMSLLEEAPGERQPVQTYVLEYDEGIIAEALRRELRRGGQTFYLCNRIERLPDVEARLSKLCPDARIETAHGRLDRDALSDIWQAMVEGEIDILISTTIIETGIDVPRANTLIIEDADKMGLSQLHQIRGRVGRSSRRAYAYFTYPKNRVLNDIQSKRLTAIRDFTEFGAGFRIALRDLEIRGTGNILGSEQHGHMDVIGYDMYMKLLSEAILEEKGEKPAPKPECSVDLSLDAFIPERYIGAGAARIDAYRKIALIESDADRSDVYDELSDRYGEPPGPVVTLLGIALIRALAAAQGITKIERRSGEQFARIYPPRSDMGYIAKLAGTYHGRILINTGTTPYFSFKLSGRESVQNEIINLLKTLSEVKNS